MSGFRAFFDFGAHPSGAAPLRLSPDESRHLCGSLRAREGDIVDLFDLSGRVKRCRIVSADPKCAELIVEGDIPVPHSSMRVYLAQCLPKGKVFDDIIRQSVEIGISGIFPIFSSRTQVRMDECKSDKKCSKWRARVVEAVKQSANFCSFEIAEPTGLGDFLRSRSGGFDLKIVASLRSGAKPISHILNSCGSPNGVCMLVGPEGDLTGEEYDMAEAAGFIPATLGKNVMKCDTAALFALSAVSAHFC